MAYITVEEARQTFRKAQVSQPLRRSATSVLNEAVRAARADSRYDVFLSHCIRDAETIAGIKVTLEERGLSVYVDWMEDQQLDRTRVTAATAELLRVRMRQSQSLLFATSDSSPDSRWMPWELGYFDGLRQGRVAVLPLVAYDGQAFVGQEYIGLYPTVEQLPRRDGELGLFVTRGVGSRTYIDLGSFGMGVTEFKAY